VAGAAQAIVMVFGMLLVQLRIAGSAHQDPQLLGRSRTYPTPLQSVRITEVEQDAALEGDQKEEAEAPLQGILKQGGGTGEGEKESVELGGARFPLEPGSPIPELCCRLHQLPK